MGTRMKKKLGQFFSFFFFFFFGLGSKLALIRSRHAVTLRPRCREAVVEEYR